MPNAASSLFAGKSVTVIISGGIAAYKVCEIVRGLIKRGADVRVAMTAHATEFVGPKTFEALTGHAVALTEWGHTPDAPMPHIELARCNLMLVAPATANLLAKAAHGIADDLASTLIAARRGPVVFMPAMNMHMWSNPATQRNVATLAAAGCHFIGPADGFQACGDVGSGRMTEPSDALDLLSGFFCNKPLAGRRVLVTAGGTYEPIDPVRGITNRSSGRQGVEIARAARDAGADVTLVAGRMRVTAPAGVRVIHADTALDMQAAVRENLADTSIFFGVAAVADWRPAEASSEKIKKDATGSAPLSQLHWLENPDILADTAAAGTVPVVVGFSAESASGDALVKLARAKLEKKGADLLVANDARAAIDADRNTVRLLTPNGSFGEFGPADKAACARYIVSAAAELLRSKTTLTH